MSDTNTITPITQYTVPEESRPSPTLSVGKAAEPAIAAGLKVTSFGAGELDITPSTEMMQEWQSKLAEANAAEPENSRYFTTANSGKKNDMKYGPNKGTSGFRQVAAEVYTRDTGIEVSAEHIDTGNGAKAVLSAMLKVLKTGDKIIMAAPGWPTNYDNPPRGVEIIAVDTDGRGLMSAEQIEAALKAHPDAKAVLINEPNNPTGNKYSKEEREAVYEKLLPYKDLLVVKDDPYGKLVFDGSDQKAGANEKALMDSGNMAVVRSMSKEYGLPGYRLGYVITRNEQVLTEILRQHGSKGGNSSNLAEDAAHAALLYGDQYIEQTIEDLKRKREILMKGFEGIDGASIDEPQSTLYGWPSFEGLRGKVVPAGMTVDGEQLEIKTPKDMMKFLIEVAGFNAVPGGAFYPPNSPKAMDDWHVRLSFAGNEKVLEQKLEDVKEAVGHLITPRIGLNSPFNKDDRQVG